LRVLVQPALQLRDAFGHFRHGFFQLQNALLKDFLKYHGHAEFHAMIPGPILGLKNENWVHLDRRIETISFRNRP
jgi:hypothetical protein